MAYYSGNDNSAIERKLGKYQDAIGTWRKALRSDPVDAFPGNGHMMSTAKAVGGSVETQETFNSGVQKSDPENKLKKETLAGVCFFVAIPVHKCNHSDTLRLAVG